MKKLSRVLIGILIIALAIAGFAGCAKTAMEEQKPIILATTTSTENSGLLDYILPSFKEETGIEAKVIAVGTGKALQMGRDGEADVLLVHAKSSEE